MTKNPKMTDAEITKTLGIEVEEFQAIKKERDARLEREAKEAELAQCKERLDALDLEQGELAGRINDLTNELKGTVSTKPVEWETLEEVLQGHRKEEDALPIASIAKLLEIGRDSPAMKPLKELLAGCRRSKRLAVVGQRNGMKYWLLG